MTVDDKIIEEKLQYDIYRETTNLSVLPSEQINK